MNYLIRYSIYPSDKKIEEHLDNLKIKYNKSIGTKGEFIIFYIYDIDEKIQKYKNYYPEKINDWSIIFIIPSIQKKK